MQNMFSQFFNDPHIRHAVLVHFPVVFGLLGILPLLALLMTGLKSKPMKVVCIAWFLLASGGAALAANSGEAAVDHLGVRSPNITHDEHEAIEAHEELAENGWIWPLVPAALVLLTFPGKGAIRKTAFVVSCVAALGVAGWVGLTAHRGGKLVYDLGIGVQTRTVPESPAKPPALDDDERSGDEPSAEDKGASSDKDEAVSGDDEPEDAAGG